MNQLTVTTLVRYLKNKIDLDPNLQRIKVNGEISNFHKHFTGHLYFSLKDETSSINCVMFKTSASLLKFEPKNGDKVILSANTSIFESTGQLQLYVTKIELDGQGDLYQQYEILKKRLENNGIFNDEHKITLKKEYIENVAVLVGDNSAAMSDIKTTFSRRWPICNVDYYPVLVQGKDAPKQIISQLQKVDKLGYDAIILARGGGSFEDLFCFNDEELVMTIYSLNTYIITGIGHEQDFTLCDFVADKRAATPTASVELITPNLKDVKETINESAALIKNNVHKLITTLQLNFDLYSEKLSNFNSEINKYNTIIDSLKNKMLNSVNKIILQNKSDIKRFATLLEAYSYQNTLKRGYSLVKQNNDVIKSSKKIKKDVFEVIFYDGKIKAKGV